MKGCILKDIYNMIHSGKSMLFIALFFAVVFISTSGAETFASMNIMMFSILIITTFSFDDNAGWFRYAVVMPMSRREIVDGKFIVLLLFSLLGAVVGIAVGFVGTVITDMSRINGEFLGSLMFTSVVALSVSWMLGSTAISLMFRFGSEKARLLMLTVFVLPVLAIFCLYKMIMSFGVVISDKLVFVLGGCSPVVAVIYSLIMYKISCRIFEKKDL